MGNEKHPPRWAQQFIEWYCKDELAEDLIGDLNEYFERNVERVGVRRAKIIYIIDAFKFLRRYTLRAPKFINVFINWIMTGSYIKTSFRNVMRNKLFSSINIVGLAISMSVGLLLIAFVFDLQSYDRFHKNGDRVYRITSIDSDRQHRTKYASASVKAGKLIREKVSGVEQVAMLRNDFSKDATVGDNIVPIKGFSAEPSIFQVLTFPFIEGNPNTALKDPYSVVLTETAAKKLFGNDVALGKAVKFDTSEYQVTGVIKDVPFFSHISFEALASYSTTEQQNKRDKNFESWTNISSNYVYLLLPENADVASIQSQLNGIAKQENRPGDRMIVDLELLPLHQIAVGEDLMDMTGSGRPHMNSMIPWVLGGLALVVILSACFNYTNLSVARSMRRFKEIGLRKVIGAGKGHVRRQFLVEAVIIALLALVLSFLMFLVLREQFVSMAPELQRMVKLDITLPMGAAFILFAVLIGIVAGFLPAVFFSKVTITNALRNAASMKVFKHISLRRALVVVQYTLTLIFITATAIGYVQYKDILAFDLGFKTENILNIRMQGNKPDAFLKELAEMPEVSATSESHMITSIGNYWGGFMKYKESRDSTLVFLNHVDENYLSLHDYKLIAGTSFIARPTTATSASEIIVNERVLKRLNIAGGDPERAIGEEISLREGMSKSGQKMRIVGVLKDFHYGKVNNLIEPVAFLFMMPEQASYVNVKINTSDIIGTMSKIESTWKRIDRVHPFTAQFYDDQIEEAYSEFSSMVKIIGFLSFLAISIASMGLFGMVVFTTETRLKEISIRKVMGADVGGLVALLSRNFVILLGASAAIAIPVTYFVFERMFLPQFPYHKPVGIIELLVGFVVVLLIAFVMIGTQTIKAARSNPAEVLKNE